LLFRVDFDQSAPSVFDKLPDVMVFDFDVAEFALADVFPLRINSGLRVLHDVERYLSKDI
jgi:hypothetical protein